jgi:hypothetical protein
MTDGNRLPCRGKWAGVIAPLSGRARAALLQHQRRVAQLQREVQVVDRVLAGALTACDGPSQHEMLGAYLEAVQELRVSLQRLEGFLLQRLAGRAAEPEPDSIEIHVIDRDALPEAAPAD